MWEEPLLKRWMSSRLDYEPISDHVLFNAGSLFISRIEGLFAYHYSLCVHYAYFRKKDRHSTIANRWMDGVFHTIDNLIIILVDVGVVMVNVAFFVLSSMFSSSCLLCLLLDQYCKDVLQWGLFWSPKRVDERTDKRRHFTFWRFIYTGEKKKESADLWMPLLREAALNPHLVN